MRIGFLIVLLNLVLSGNFIFAQSDPFDPAIRMLFLNLDTVAGNRLLNDRYKPHDAEYVRIAGYREFLGSLLHQSKANIEQFSRSSGAWLDLLEKADGDRLSNQAAMAEIHLYRSVLASQISDYKTSATEMIACYKIVARYGVDFSANDRNKLSGILGVLFHQIPDQYGKYLKLLGVRPSSLSGYNGLERYYGSARPGSAQRIEGYLLLISSMKELSPDPAAAWNFIRAEGQPMLDNPLVRYQSALAALKAGDCDMAVKLLENLPAGDVQAIFPYWFYQLGRTKLYQDNPGCPEYLARFLKNPGGDNYRHAAMAYSAWYFLIHGQRDKAYQILSGIKSLPEPLCVYDRQALNEATAEKLPTPELLKARFIFDGGYYDRCLDFCGKMIASGTYSGRDLGELYYRKARSEQRLGRSSDAIQTFMKVIDRENEIKTYVVPNSALQVGYLYKKAGQTDLARKYYHICLDLNKYGFRDGINRQAQAALRELDK